MKRYREEVIFVGDQNFAEVEMVESDDGDWVTYDDAQALEAKAKGYRDLEAVTSNDLLSAQERIEKSAAYNHKLSASLVQAQEWLEQSRDENKALRELLDHVWCEGVDDYWVKNDGKKWQERLKELEIIPEKWPLKKGKNTN